MASQERMIPTPPLITTPIYRLGRIADPSFDDLTDEEWDALLNADEGDLEEEL